MDHFAEGWLHLRARCGVCGRLVGGWNCMWRISSSVLSSSFSTSHWEPTHTSPMARTACPTPNAPLSSAAPTASSAPSHRPRLTQASRLQGNTGRRLRWSQGRRLKSCSGLPFAGRSRPPTMAHSRPSFAAKASPQTAGKSRQPATAN